VIVAEDAAAVVAAAFVAVVAAAVAVEVAQWRSTVYVIHDAGATFDAAENDAQEERSVGDAMATRCD
jgi:uncharacterized membrane protein